MSTLPSEHCVRTARSFYSVIAFPVRTHLRICCAVHAHALSLLWHILRAHNNNCNAIRPAGVCVCEAAYLRAFAPAPYTIAQHESSHSFAAPASAAFDVKYRKCTQATRRRATRRCARAHQRCVPPCDSRQCWPDAVRCDTHGDVGAQHAATWKNGQHRSRCRIHIVATQPTRTQRSASTRRRAVVYDYDLFVRRLRCTELRLTCSINYYGAMYFCAAQECRTVQRVQSVELCNWAL